LQSWNFLTNHGRVLLCIASDPEARLREIAASIDITERRAHGIVSDLVEAGYVVKTKIGRRNHYRIQAHLPLPEPMACENAIGEVLELLVGPDRSRDRSIGGPERGAWARSPTNGSVPAGSSVDGLLPDRQTATGRPQG